MTRIAEALCLAIVLLAIAGLAALGAIPGEVARFAPLAVVPWIIRRTPSCALRRA